jgi:hypothetical protein
MAGLSVPLDEVVHFDADTSSTTTGGESNADSTPVFRVYEEDNDTAILGPTNMTLRTGLTGGYRGTFTASAANGFEVGKWYIVKAFGTVGAVNGKVTALIFRLTPAESSAGVPKVDMSHHGGTAYTGGAIPSAVAGAAGGLFIAGSNAATTVATLTVSGTTTLTGAVSLGSTLTTTGLVTFAGLTVSGTTTFAFAAATKAEIQSEAEDAIVAHRLDELLNADSDIDGAAPPTVGSVFHELMSKTAGSFTFDQTTDSLEAVRDRGDAAWITATGFSTLDAAGIRTAVGLGSANLDTQLADLPTVAEFEARTLVAANYFDPAADTVANVTTVGSVTTKTGYALTSDYDFAKGTVAVTEAYAADGAAPTPVQALMLIQQALTEVSISSTTMTIKKLDGSTTAATLTLNDASTPTSKTRAT